MKHSLKLAQAQAYDDTELFSQGFQVKPKSLKYRNNNNDPENK